MTNIANDVQKLLSMNACAPMISFVEECGGMENAWATCTRPHWMLQLVGRTLGTAQRSLGLAKMFAVRADPEVAAAYVTSLTNAYATYVALSASSAYAGTYAAESYAAEAAAYAAYDVAHGDDAEIKRCCDLIRAEFPLSELWETTP